MKRINWFKTIGLSAATIAAVTPIVTMSTSCTVTRTTVDCFTYATLKTAADKYNFDTFTSTKISFEKLLIGDLSITDGNFIVIVGSNKMDNTCKFFSGDANIRRKSDWFGNCWLNSTLCKGVIDDEKRSEEKVPFTIFNMVDYSPENYYDKKGKLLFISEDGKTPMKYINPFRKWTTSLIDSTYRFNAYERKISGGTYEWDKESVKADKDYIRNDASAVAYRAFCELGAKLYPKSDKEPKRTITFETDDKADGSRIVVFKEGKLTALDNLPADGKAFAEIINKNFLKDSEKK